MEKTKKFTVGFFGVALIFLLALPGCDDDGGTPNPNVNQVKGKSFYVADTFITKFKADLTFEKLTWEFDQETWESGYWGPSAKGSYTYNSKKKTFTVTNSHIWGEGEDSPGVSGWLTIDESPNKAWFAPVVYIYEITKDGSLLAQQVFTANKGVDELKGETYLRIPDVGRHITFTFAETGNTFTRSDSDTTGTYSFDSTGKTVFLRPTSVDGMTMAGYYAAYDVEDNWTQHTEPAVIKAAVTNSVFAGSEMIYDPELKTCERKYSW
jgi:hypothetical protein